MSDISFIVVHIPSYTIISKLLVRNQTAVAFLLALCRESLGICYIAHKYSLISVLIWDLFSVYGSTFPTIDVFS